MSAPRPLPQRMEHHPVARVLLSALAGTLLFLACADFDIWPLAWFGLFPLLFMLLDAAGHPRTRRPFLYGWICGLLANGGGFYWAFHRVPFRKVAGLGPGKAYVAFRQATDLRFTREAQVVEIRPSCVWAGGETLAVV